MYKEFITKKNELYNIIEVDIKDISTKDFNPRKSGLLQENVEKLIKAEEFPPIHLGYLDDELIVVDGYHRLSATQRLGFDKIKAFITKFDTESDLRKQAFISNINHGIKLSELDVALNIYEFYILEKKDRPTTSLTKVIAEYNIPNRRGRQLFFWTLINRVILENNNKTITELSKSEEYIKIINNRGEKYNSLSLVLKDEIRKFYNKYNYLVIPELRKAILLFLEGKDYLEELEKEKEIQLEKEKEVLNTQQSIKENVSFLENEEYDVYKKDEEIISKEPYFNDTSSNKKSKNKHSITNTISKIGEDIMTIRRLQVLNKIDFTKEDYLSLNDLIDRIDEIKSDIDTECFFNQSVINEF